MAGLFSFFNKSSELSDSELPEIFPLSLTQDVFNRADIVATFFKILTDTLERTHGLSKKYEPLLWDNCVQTEANAGLITLLAEAMACKRELFLVFVPSVMVLREATSEEKQKIQADYKKDGESKNGVFISFKNYRRSEMLAIYSNLEYCVLSSLHKSLNISKAVQIKISKLRESVNLLDATVASGQARTIAKALERGKDVYLDKEDEITTATPDTSATEKAIGFLDAKRAFILGLPLAYISGLQSGGIGNTGEADTKAIERGLKQYFVSIIQPVLKALFGQDVEFKSQDFRQMTTALEVLKTFELTSDEYLSKEGKTDIVRRAFEVDENDEEKALKAEAAQAQKDAANGVAPPSTQKLKSNPNQDPQRQAEAPPAAGATQ